MNASPNYFILSLISLALFSPQLATGNAAAAAATTTTVGAIIDATSRVGKEAKLAIEMAIEDFNNRSTNPTLVHLQIRNSQGKPFQAALAARDLIDNHQVNAIIGPHTWDQVSSIAEVTSDAHIPILSLADSPPQWATSRWPFLVQASPTHHAQMKAVAALIHSRGWPHVTFIYEDTDSTSGDAVRHISDTLRPVAAAVVGLPPSASLSEELERLKKNKNCRVFVVHTSLELGVSLFYHANKMGMMEKGYIWITTNTITDALHSINASATSSMQGLVGVKTYSPKMNLQQFQDFTELFRTNFTSDHGGEEENNEPGIYAVHAYNATMATLDPRGNGFIDNATSRIFQIVNMHGEGYKVLGFWSDGLGFSETIDDGASYNSSIGKLGKVFWPGGTLDSPRGPDLLTWANPLRVGVPTNSLFEQFVSVNFTSKASYTGFSIETFREIIKNLPFDLPYEFFPYEGDDYDELVESIYNKTFDAVAGDVTTTKNRSEKADFTLPYTESGLEMIVAVRSRLCDNAWLFMTPLTKEMLVIILAITIYNGFVLWLIERDHRPELKGSAWNQIGTLLSLAFTTLFSLHGGKLHSNLSRMTMVVWLFVAIILTHSYTANLASMLTAQILQPTVSDIKTLKDMKASVGYCRGSFIDRYLVDVLEFQENNTRRFTTDEEYAEALRSGDITALFLEVPSAKLFLSKYCRSFIRAGPTFKVGGFGFAFPKGFPMLRDINQAILNVTESGKLQELEDLFIGSEKCVEGEPNTTPNLSINLSSFWLLFVLTGGISTLALALYVVVCMRKHWRCLNGRRSSSRRIWPDYEPDSPSSAIRKI